MKKLLASIVLLLLMFIFAGCGSKGTSSEIVLTEVGGYVYTWDCEINNDKIVMLSGQTSESEPFEGGEVTIHYIYTGLKKGSTTIKCNYTNGTDIKETKKYKATVDKDLNVSIYEK